MRNIEEVVNNVKGIEDETIGLALKLIGDYGSQVVDFLAQIAAELCRVDVDDMLGDTRNIDNVRARWFYWYAYRYMTEESHEKIASTLSKGRQFDRATIGQGISKIGMLIGDECIWRRRWVAMKKIIGIIIGSTESAIATETPVVTVVCPKGVNVELKRE